MAGNPSIGTRAYGRRSIRERWYECAICGQPVPMSETIVPEWPHPHAGRRVCLQRCYDETDYKMRLLLTPPKVSQTEGEP